MPTEDDDQNEGGEGQQAQVTIPRSQIRALEKSANEGKQALARLAELERREAFREAGLDLSNKGVTYFVKAYDGELTAEAIKAAAAEAGFIQEKPQTQAPAQQTQLPQERGSQNPLLAEQFETMERIRRMSTQPLSAPDTQQAYYAELAAAKNPDEVMAIASRYGLPTTNDRW